MPYSNLYSTFGQPASGPSSSTSSSQPYPTSSQHYPTSSSISTSSNMTYPQPSSSTWRSTSSSSNSNGYIANSQQAWMNWPTVSTLSSIPTQPGPSSASSSSTYNSTPNYNPSNHISYGFPSQPNDDYGDYSTSGTVVNGNINGNGNGTGSGSSYPEQKDHLPLTRKDKRFDCAFAAPAINLGTGDRFSQLLEAKMSMMNGDSPISSDGGMGSSQFSGIPSQLPQIWDGPIQPYSTQSNSPIQPYPSQSNNQNSSNSYQPSSTNSSTPVSQDMFNFIPSGYISPNRYSMMNMPPPPLPQISNPNSSIISPSSSNDRSGIIDQPTNEMSLQTQWMPNPGIYSIPPPPPPQDDTPVSISPKLLPYSNVQSFPTQILSPLQPQPQPSRTRTDIIPQNYYAGDPYHQQPHQRQQDERRVHDPFAVEKSLSDFSQTQIPPDLVAPLPSSRQLYQRQRTPPIILGENQRYDQTQPSTSFNQNQTQYPLPYPPAPLPSLPQSNQPSPLAPNWISSQPMSSTSTIISNPDQQHSEELPPLLKIRVKDTGNSNEDINLDKSSKWTSNQPGLIKKNKLPKEVSGSRFSTTIKQKGKKFSLVTSIHKADLVVNKGRKDIHTDTDLLDKVKGKGKNKKNDEEDELDDDEDAIKPEEIYDKEDLKLQKKKRKNQKVTDKQDRMKQLQMEEDSQRVKSVELDNSLSSSLGKSQQKQLIEKTVIACNNCRAKKLKCNGEKPKCFHCHRRGEDNCSYEAILKRRGPGKHNKEKQPKPIKPSKKRKLNREGKNDEIRDETPLDANSNTHSHPNSDTESETGSEHESTPIQSKSKSTDNQAPQKEKDDGNDNERFESFGLGGGGSEGRIKSRRLNEDELKIMSYILPNKNNNKTQNENSILGMGFGNDFNMNNMNPSSVIGGVGIGPGGMQNYGTGSRFELSTARD